LPNAARAVRMLNDTGLPVFVVTNQGGIHHRDQDFDWDRYNKIEEKMHALLDAEAGARVDAVYVCPDADYMDSDDRKPNTGMFARAQREHGFDPTRSFMIGDSEADIIAGTRFGMRTLLVTSGWQKDVPQLLRAQSIEPEWTGPGLLEAVEYVLSRVEVAS
jgi:histidinol-phosphate phosphatase family protein